MLLQLILRSWDCVLDSICLIILIEHDVTCEVFQGLKFRKLFMRVLYFLFSSYWFYLTFELLPITDLLKFEFHTL